MIHHAHLRDVHHGRLAKGIFGEGLMDFQDKLHPSFHHHTKVHEYLKQTFGAADYSKEMKASRRAAAQEAREFDKMMKNIGKYSSAGSSSAASSPAYGGGYRMTQPSTPRLRTVGVGGTATAV